MFQSELDDGDFPWPESSSNHEERARDHNSSSDSMTGNEAKCDSFWGSMSLESPSGSPVCSGGSRKSVSNVRAMSCSMSPEASFASSDCFKSSPRLVGRDESFGRSPDVSFSSRDNSIRNSQNSVSVGRDGFYNRSPEASFGGLDFSDSSQRSGGRDRAHSMSPSDAAFASRDCSISSGNEAVSAKRALLMIPD